MTREFNELVMEVADKVAADVKRAPLYLRAVRVAQVACELAVGGVVLAAHVAIIVVCGRYMGWW